MLTGSAVNLRQTKVAWWRDRSRFSCVVDDVSNLELTDFEVYWSLSASILATIRGLPEGASIGEVSITDRAAS